MSWQPMMWSSALLANFAKQLSAIGISNMDYQGELANGAKTVRILVPTAGTVKTYSPSTAIAWEAVGESYKDLTLDKQEYVAMKVDDVNSAKAQTDIYINSVVAPSGRALAGKVDADIYSVAGAAITGSAGDVGVDLSDLTSTTLVSDTMAALLQAGENLDKKDAPREGRFLVASPRTHSALVMTGQLMNAGQFAENTLVEGAIGRIAGFDVIPSNNLVNKSQSVIGTAKAGDHGLYGVRGSIAAAVRLAGEPEYVRLPDFFADGVRMLTLYGFEVVRPAGLGRFISQTAA